MIPTPNNDFSQPKGSETTRDAMKEDLIEESAFEVEEKDQYTQKASAKII